MEGPIVEQSSTPEQLSQPVAEPSEPALDGAPQPPLERKPPGKRNRTWIWLVLPVLAGVVAFFFMQRHGQGGQTAARASLPQAPLSIATDTARQGSISNYINALGTVTALNTVTIKSRVDGQLMSVNYREGQFVQAGSLLAEIDPRTFQAQLTEAEGQYQRDQAILNNALLDLARYRTAYSKNAIPKQQLDTQESTVHQYEGIVKNDQGQIDNAKLELVYCHITAPISGRVGLRLVDPGNIVHASDTNGLLVITQLQPISVTFSVAEDFLPQIQKQLRSGRHLAVDVLDRSQQTKIASGFLSSVDNEIDTSTGTVKLKGIFPNQSQALFPNQFVNAKLLVTTERDVTLISTSAIQRNTQGAFVYLVKRDQTVLLQSVKLGMADDNVTAVEGIKPGDVVAIDGFDKLQNGIKVNPRTENNASGRSKS